MKMVAERSVLRPQGSKLDCLKKAFAARGAEDNSGHNEV